MSVRKPSAPGRSGGFGFYMVLVAAVVWWAPTIVIALARIGAGWVELWLLVRRARQLRLAGKLHEAMTVLERAEDRFRARGGGRDA